VNTPGVMTSQLQVLDMVVNNHSKGQLHDLYDEGLSYRNCPVTTARNIRLSAALLGHYWIKMTWYDRIHQEGVERAHCVK